jgi:hypothetical protein
MKLFKAHLCQPEIVPTLVIEPALPLASHRELRSRLSYHQPEVPMSERAATKKTALNLFHNSRTFPPKSVRLCDNVRTIFLRMAASSEVLAAREFQILASLPFKERHLKPHYHPSIGRCKCDRPMFFRYSHRAFASSHSSSQDQVLFAYRKGGFNPSRVV